MTRPQLQHDLKASIVVFLVALPLCLGIALASGAPLASGIIAGIVGGLVIGMASDSQISVSGPAAGLTVIVASGIIKLGGFEVFSWAVFVSGLIQIIFGIVRGGSIGDYFPTSVIKGMLAAIGLILIIKQLPLALGLPKGSTSPSDINGSVVVISGISLIIMIIWEKLALKGQTFFKLVPGPLVAVVTSVILNHLFDFITPDGLVKLPESLFSGINIPRFPEISYAVIEIGVTLAIVASLETLLCIDAAEKIDPEKRKVSKNRELLAQGLGNTVSGLLGGLPLTAVIVRTSANVAAGAKTKYSAIFHGLWLIVCVLLIPGVLNMIPLASLASVLLLTGYKLTKPVFFKEMAKRGTDQLFIYLVTIGAILATDLLKGIFIGFVTALIFELRKPAISCLEVTHEEDKVHFKFVKNVSFLHKAKILELLNKLEDGKSVYFYGMKEVRMHVDVHELIQDYHEQAKKKKRHVFFH